MESMTQVSKTLATVQPSIARTITHSVVINTNQRMVSTPLTTNSESSNNIDTTSMVFKDRSQESDTRMTAHKTLESSQIAASESEEIMTSDTLDTGLETSSRRLSARTPILSTGATDASTARSEMESSSERQSFITYTGSSSRVDSRVQRSSQQSGPDSSDIRDTSLSASSEGAETSTITSTDVHLQSSTHIDATKSSRTMKSSEVSTSANDQSDDMTTQTSDIKASNVVSFDASSQESKQTIQQTSSVSQDSPRPVSSTSVSGTETDSIVIGSSVHFTRTLMSTTGNAETPIVSTTGPPDSPSVETGATVQSASSQHREDRSSGVSDPMTAQKTPESSQIASSESEEIMTSDILDTGLKTYSMRFTSRTPMISTGATDASQTRSQMESSSEIESDITYTGPSSAVESRVQRSSEQTGLDSSDIRDTSLYPRSSGAETSPITSTDVHVQSSTDIDATESSRTMQSSKVATGGIDQSGDTTIQTSGTAVPSTSNPHREDSSSGIRQSGSFSPTESQVVESTGVDSSESSAQNRSMITPLNTDETIHKTSYTTDVESASMAASSTNVVDVNPSSVTQTPSESISNVDTISMVITDRSQVSDTDISKTMSDAMTAQKTPESSHIASSESEEIMTSDTLATGLETPILSTEATDASTIRSKMESSTERQSEVDSRVQRSSEQIGPVSSDISITPYESRAIMTTREVESSLNDVSSIRMSRYQSFVPETLFPSRSSEVESMESSGDETMDSLTPVSPNVSLFPTTRDISYSSMTILSSLESDAGSGFYPSESPFESDVNSPTDSSSLYTQHRSMRSANSTEFREQSTFIRTVMPDASSTSGYGSHMSSTHQLSSREEIGESSTDKSELETSEISLITSSPSTQSTIQRSDLTSDPSEGSAIFTESLLTPDLSSEYIYQSSSARDDRSESILLSPSTQELTSESFSTPTESSVFVVSLSSATLGRTSGLVVSSFSSPDASSLVDIPSFTAPFESSMLTLPPYTTPLASSGFTSSSFAIPDSTYSISKSYTTTQDISSEFISESFTTPDASSVLITPSFSTQDMSSILSPDLSSEFISQSFTTSDMSSEFVSLSYSAPQTITPSFSTPDMSSEFSPDLSSELISQSFTTRDLSSEFVSLSYSTPDVSSEMTISTSEMITPSFSTPDMSSEFSQDFSSEFISQSFTTPGISSEFISQSFTTPGLSSEFVSLSYSTPDVSSSEMSTFFIPISSDVSSEFVFPSFKTAEVSSEFVSLSVSSLVYSSELFYSSDVSTGYTLLSSTTEDLRSSLTIRSLSSVDASTDLVSFTQSISSSHFISSSLTSPDLSTDSVLPTVLDSSFYFTTSSVEESSQQLDSSIQSSATIFPYSSERFESSILASIPDLSPSPSIEASDSQSTFSSHEVTSTERMEWSTPPLTSQPNIPSSFQPSESRPRSDVDIPSSYTPEFTASSIQPTPSFSDYPSSSFPPVFPSASVTPGPSTETPDVTTQPVSPAFEDLLIMTVRVTYGHNISDGEYREAIERGLLKAYLIGLTLPVSNRRKRALPDVLPPNPDNYAVTVEDIEESDAESTADITFYVWDKDTGAVLPAEDVEPIFKRMAKSDISAYVGQSVLDYPRALASKDEDGLPFWLWILIAILVLIILIIILVALLWKRGYLSERSSVEPEARPEKLAQKTRRQNQRDLEKQPLVMREKPFPMYGSQKGGTLLVKAEEDHSPSEMGKKLYAEDLKKKKKKPKLQPRRRLDYSGHPPVAPQSDGLVRKHIILTARDSTKSVPETKKAKDMYATAFALPEVQFRDAESPRSPPSLSPDEPPSAYKYLSPAPSPRIEITQRSAPGGSRRRTRPLQRDDRYSYEDAPTLRIREYSVTPTKVQIPVMSPVVIRSNDPAQFEDMYYPEEEPTTPQSQYRHRNYFSDNDMSEAGNRSSQRRSRMRDYFSDEDYPVFADEPDMVAQSWDHRRDYFSGDDLPMVPTNPQKDYLTPEYTEQVSSARSSMISASTASQGKDWDYDGDNDSVFYVKETENLVPKHKHKRVKKPKPQEEASDFYQTAWVESERPSNPESKPPRKPKAKPRTPKTKKSKVDPERVPDQDFIEMKMEVTEPEIIPMQVLPSAEEPPRAKTPDWPIVNAIETEVLIPVTRLNTSFEAQPTNEIKAPIPLTKLRSESVSSSPMIPTRSPSPPKHVTHKPPISPKVVLRKKKVLPVPPPPEVAAVDEEKAKASILGLKKSSPATPRSSSRLPPEDVVVPSPEPTPSPDGDLYRPSNRKNQVLPQRSESFSTDTDVSLPALDRWAMPSDRLLGDKEISTYRERQPKARKTSAPVTTPGNTRDRSQKARKWFDQDDDSLSIGERSLEVQPRDRLPLHTRRRHTALFSSGEDTVSVDSMELDLPEAGLFEHVAKMSRLTEPQSPVRLMPGANLGLGTNPFLPAMPPVRYQASLQPDTPLTSLIMPTEAEFSPPGGPQPSDRRTNTHVPASPIPVKLNMEAVKQVAKSTSGRDESDLDSVAAKEKSRNKHRQREKDVSKDRDNLSSDKRDGHSKRKSKTDKKKKKSKSRKSKDAPPAEVVPVREVPQHSSRDSWRHHLPDGFSSADDRGDKLGRSMRAAPRSRTASECSSLVSRVSSTREQELLARLHQQQVANQQRDQMRRMAQELINQAYQQDVEVARQQHMHDQATATKLLNEAFPLANLPRPSSSNRSESPRSPPLRTSNQSGSAMESNASVKSEPFLSSTKSSVSTKKPSALERLLNEGTLVSGLSSGRPSATSHLQTGAWTQQPTSSIGDQGRPDREQLLEVVREEFRSMQPPSSNA